MTSNFVVGGQTTTDIKEDEDAGRTTSLSEETNLNNKQHEQQSVDIFIRHVGQQLRKEQENRDRRPSLPIDVIELPTLSGVVMRRKQQLQLQQQQQPTPTTNNSNNNSQKHLSPNNCATKGRPLSICSVSSAASTNSSSSSNSSASSGVQSSLTRNGSLNHGLESRKNAYLASIESLNSPPQHQNATLASFNALDTQSIEASLRNLNLSPSTHFKDAATRAAILAAGAQSRGFNTSCNNSNTSNIPKGGNKLSRINRSLHASLRYDKNTAYRIHLMANSRALLANANNTLVNDDDPNNSQRSSRGGSISRNNSSTSSDSGHQQQIQASSSSNGSRFICRCGSNPSITSSSSAPQVDQAINDRESSTNMIRANSNNNKAATLDSGSLQRSIQHHPDCSYSNKLKLRRGSAKLQPSPSSASSHSNNSSLFRDDGFEDDLTSTGSEQMSAYHQHRLSFQNKIHGLNNQYHHRRTGDDEDDYQSCEEEFANSNTTASTASNFDDCALSTTSSSILQHDQQVLDKISLANAKQQYRKSLLLEHQQQQYLLHAQHVGQNSRIQSLLIPSSKINHHLGSLSPNHSANTSNASSASCTSPSRPPKFEDRTVNIIGHMPTKSPGYWDSNLSITQRVVTEIIETERTYVDDLEQIVTGYICYLRNVLKQQKHKQSQNNLDMKQTHAKDPNTNIDGQDDYKTMVYDDETTNAMNEIEDYDVDETDNDLTTQKENHEDRNLPNLKSSEEESQHIPAAIISASHIKKLFSNLEDIYKFNKDLLFRLEECYLNPSSVAECFVENAAGFEVYTHYCTMYPQVVSTLTELMGDINSAQLLKERQTELNQSLPLGAYLLKPVQRILKYHILFQSLIKHTTDDDTIVEKDRQLIGEAFSVMTSIACHINAMKKRHEHAIRIQEVQGLLSGWDGPDLTTFGELLLEDTFKLYNRPKSHRHLFLFDNVLLLTKKKSDGSLCYKGHIACSNLMLIENIEGQPLVFNTVPFDNPKALHAFQAKTLDKKRDWCIQIKEMILKSFEVEIPLHVRDILMSLTNSNNDASPKSSSETARLLRAPNYLEKKRIKHDKKK